MVQIADIGRILGEASQAFCMRISPGNVITIGHAWARSVQLRCGVKTLQAEFGRLLR